MGGESPGPRSEPTRRHHPGDRVGAICGIRARRSKSRTGITEMMRASVDQTLRASLPCKSLPNIKERNIISLTKSQIVGRKMHPDQLAGRQNGARTRTNNTARELHVTTSTQLTNTTPTRALLAEEMLCLLGNVEVGPGTGRRSLR